MSDLQLSLLLLGAVLVTGIFIYGKWQERKHRHAAEQAFNLGHADVLLEPGAAAERIEPKFEPVPGEEEEPERPARRETGEPDQTGASENALPSLPVIDAAIDCIVGLESVEPVAAADLLMTFSESRSLLTKPCHWLGLFESKWDLLTDASQGHYTQLRAAIQLADRNGPIAEAELNSFLNCAQLIARKFGATISLPKRSSILTQATELDRLCVEVDVQIGINIISRDAGGWERALLIKAIQNAGMRQQADYTFHAVNKEDRAIFILSGVEQVSLSSGNSEAMNTSQVTLVLEVPCVSEGGMAFDGMIAVARQLVEHLGGRMVDDKRNPLDDGALKIIRAKIIEFQQGMAQRGIPAGGELALRLFG